MNPYVVDDVRRRKFITEEMRTRRYKLLPSLDLHRAVMEKWRFDVHNSRKVRLGLHASFNNHDTGYLERNVFMIPPPRPTAFPTEAEIMSWIRTARLHPKGGGWSEIVLRPSSADACTGRRKGSNESVVDESVMVASEKYLRSVGLEIRALPGYHGKRPDFNAGSGGPLAHSSPTPTPRAMFSG